MSFSGSPVYVVENVCAHTGGLHGPAAACPSWFAAPSVVRASPWFAPPSTPLPESGDAPEKTVEVLEQPTAWSIIKVTRGVNVATKILAFGSCISVPSTWPYHRSFIAPKPPTGNLRRHDGPDASQLGITPR